MEENMTMIAEVEENNNVEIVESNSTVGEKALGAAVLTFAGIGIVTSAKWVGGKIKGLFRRKKKTVDDVEFVVEETGEREEVDSE